MSTPTPVQSFHWGTGRRKTAVARVRLREGNGTMKVNDRDTDSYFPDVLWQERVKAPLVAGDLVGKVDCFVKVKGGGVSSQAGAVMLGVARALVKMRPDLEAALRDKGYLTRDSRMVERKKYGHKKARKSFQFSKR
jgi:small subunit ribosomal protein S9